MEETIPEDIPADVWKYAEAVEKVWRDLPPREAVEHHARAIMAERERCAKVAGAYADEAYQEGARLNIEAKSVVDTLGASATLAMADVAAAIATSIRSGV